MPNASHYLLLLFLIFNLTPFTWAVEYSDTCGKEWQWVNPLSQGNSLFDTDWSREQKQFISVGQAGTILTSTDGISWLKQSSGSSSWLLDIIWNGKLWVAVGSSGTILTSADGISWQKQRSGTSKRLYGTHWNGKLWVVVGSKGIILTSTDGVSWQQQSSETSELLFGIYWNGDLWVTVGFKGTILTSTDGISWQEQNSGTSDSLNDIHWNGHLWVAVGFSGTILISIDGINWQKQSVKALDLNGIHWDGNLWVAVGGKVDPEEGVIFTSTDGIGWQEQNSGTLNYLNGVHWNGSLWITMGWAGTILISADGINWISQSSGVSNNLSGIQWNKKLWVAVGESGTIVTSPNGISWQEQSSGTPNDLMDIHWNGKLWVAVGGNHESGSILISTDGVSWQEHGFGASDDLNDIHWNGKLWIAVGKSGTFVSSADGISWQTQSSGISNDLYGIHWNGTLWVVVGEEGTVLTSADGISWQMQNSGTSSLLYNVHWNGNLWMSVGRNGTILTSTDGVSWQTQNSGTSLWLIDLYWIENLWVVVGSSGTIITSTDGISWQAQNSGTANYLVSIHWNGKLWVTVGDDGTILTSSCYPKNNFVQTKSIIIAGGGNLNDPLQDATNQNANLAYQTLRERGIAADNIKYFNPIPQDADNDGVIDTESEMPTTETIKRAIMQWAAANSDSRTPVLIYLIDHGGKDIFYLNKPVNDYAEVIKADEFSSWLNTLQEQTSARVSLIYDACHSGSFMDELKQSPTQDYDRNLLFSSTPEQLAYFGAKGALSFSHFFWNNIGQGFDVRTAHRSATIAVRAVTQNDGKSYQSTMMDDNGDGQDNYVDGSLARDTYLGIDNNQEVIYPQIVKHQGSTTIDISQNGKLDLFTRIDLSKEQISRVWAVVIPPDSKTTGSEAITELPVIELDNYNQLNGHYEASSELFKQSGQYTVSYYAKTKAGVNSRFPIVSLITVTDSGYQALEQKDLHAVIVVGEDTSSSLHKAATNNANLAYQTLRNRGVNRDNIYYLNNELQDADGDGQIDTQSKTVNSSTIKNALNQWAQSKVNSTTPLLIYLIGNGADKKFIISASDTLSAGTLVNWVNELQNNTKARVTFIYDAPESGSFMTAMANSDKEYERINLFSTQAEQGAYYGADGQLSFSYFFWGNTARGLDVRQAFLNTRRTLSTATRSLRSVDSYQQALMDDNGDGVWNSHSDGGLAKVTHLGLNAATASTFPVIFEHQVSALNTNNIKLTAKVDLPPELIQKVWVLINTPQQSVATVTAISQLPAVELTYNPQNKTFAGSTTALTQTGNYTLTYYAQSTQGNISEPVNSIVQVDNSGQSSLFQCATIDSDINITLPCISVGQQLYQASLTLPQNSDSILWQLNSISINQSAANDSHCTTLDNQANLLINCIRVGGSDYKILLNFHHNAQQFWWEFGGLIEQ
ncbi:MAG: hypothetical protein KZQ83_00350 [gamma proteobacterium symbiont of Taylorina sp.]|nr:hypothetical protein [gamma proteobacterium symbiont of Taylorina sp.]